MTREHDKALRQIAQAKQTRATSLDLSQLRLNTVPHEAESLTQLTALDLSGNTLSQLPDWLGSFTQLTTLKLYNNNLSQLPETLASLTQLTTLSLGNSGLSKLPDWLGSFTQLTTLDVGFTRLSQLPDWLRSLTQLTTLRLHNNRLSQLPDWIGSLTQLANLGLSGNQLSQLPKTFASLTRLTTLDLTSNSLSQLPETLASLTQLVSLSLNDNPLVSPPPEVVAGGTEAVLSYLRASRSSGMERLWRSKLLLVGQGRAGKSTLVSVLDGRGFQDPPSTVGVALSQLSVDTHGLAEDLLKVSELTMSRSPEAGERPQQVPEMRLSVWDFGGQEIYHATHQFFLTDRSLFLVVWNTNQGYDNSRLPYWLETVTARAPGAPILLVATHGDQRPADLPLDELRARFQGIVGAVTVDSATGRGIDRLRELIAYYAARLPLMGAPWPQSWAAAADALRDRTEHHTTMAAARTLLDEHQVTVQEQDELLAALTVLGDVLHYPDDPRLADTVVLQPEWLNTRIARILDSPAVHDRGGLLLWSDVHAEWADVPQDMREHFLTMMDRYDISYRVYEPDSATASIVTALLPWQRPKLGEHWHAHYDGRQATVTYRLNFIPPGIPTWFITRTRRFTVHHWRTGALLRDQESGTLALVEATPDTGALRIAVRGENLHRFLPLLLAELSRSLDRYPGLTVQRLIACPHPDGPDHTAHNYHHLHLLKALLRREKTVSCPETGGEIPIDPLLAGINLDPGELAELARNIPLRELEAAFGDKFDQLDDMARGIAVLRTAAAEAVGVHCPSIFTVRKVRTGPLRRRYELRVCCQQAGGWHEVPGKDAAYDLRVLHTWALKIAPTAQTIASTAKAAAPLISLLLAGIALDLHGSAKKELQTARTHLNAIPGHVPLLEPTPGSAAVREVTTPTAFAHNDADYRQIHRMLEALDAARINQPTWGGLSATLDSTGHTIYLCPEHAPPR